MKILANATPEEIYLLNKTMDALIEAAGDAGGAEDLSEKYHEVFKKIDPKATAFVAAVCASICSRVNALSDDALSGMGASSEYKLLDLQGLDRGPFTTSMSEILHERLGEMGLDKYDYRALTARLLTTISILGLIAKAAGRGLDTAALLLKTEYPKMYAAEGEK